MRVSVIIPVYNAAKTISRCIDSILAQTEQNWEIVIVDDGSTDESGIICDRYASNDARIRVIHQTNQGVGAARQIGLDNVTGKYVIHADADDWVDSTMLQELCDKADVDHSDMVICDYIAEYSDLSVYESQKPTLVNNSVILRELCHNLHGSCWNKLVRTCCFKKYGIHFTKGVCYCEDKLVIIQLLLRPISISYLPKAFYHYDQFSSNSSLTRDVTLQTHFNQKCYIEELTQLLPKDSLELRREKEFVINCAILNKLLQPDDLKRLYPEIRYDSSLSGVPRLISFFRYRGNCKTADLIETVNDRWFNLKLFMTKPTPNIPKLIHLCWFSGEIPSLKILKYLFYWKLFLPDYKIMWWDKKKALATGLPFVREAIEKKKWAFAADAIRVYAVYHYGGIYMDSDIYVRKRFTDILHHDNVFFSEYWPDRAKYEQQHPELPDDERWGTEIQAAMFAAKKGSPVIKHILEHYEENHFVNDDGSLNMCPIAPQIFARRLEKYGYQYKDEFQNLDNDTVVFPSSIVAPHHSLRGKNNIAIHQCSQSWQE